MLGAGSGDTTASVLGGGGGGTDGNAASVSAVVSGGGAHDGSSEGGSVVAAANVFGSNGNNSNSGDDERVRVDEGERGFGGNRWPRQETLALLKIRSDMDVTFRDASVKGPLWEEVSRKLAELGYHRSAKKCKEKFENVYKYHKRTKDSRTGKKLEGKTYRFSNHLQVLETHHSIQSTPTAAGTPPQLKPQSQTMMPAANPPTPSLPNITVTSATVSSLPHNIVPPPTNSNPTIPSNFPNFSADLMSNRTSPSTSSDLESNEGRRKRKRKWKGFFEKLMKEVVQEQEEMQKKFLEALEKRELERLVREEAWRMQEIARIDRERQLLAQERSIAAAKDSALMALLQKLSDQKNPGQPQINPPQPHPHVPVVAPPPPPPPVVSQPVMNLEVTKRDNGDQSYTASSSRWPKAEVQALIELRTRLDNKYHDSGAKGPLWEEISGAMKRLGYNRNAKRCKEKWENINKYFKRVKDNQKERPEDAKTCPYFHQLDALYREKNKHDTSVPLMVQPEQQCPPPPPPPSDQPYHRGDRVMENLESDQNRDGEGDDEEEDEDEDEGGGGGDYEIVASRPVSMGT